MIDSQSSLATSFKRLLPAWLALMICLPVQAAEDWSDDWEATLEAAVADDSKPVLAKFEASWCGPCKLLTEALQDPEAMYLLKQMHKVKIDVDHPPAEAPVEGVNALPTMRVMTSTGEVISEHVGLIQGDPLMQWLRDAQEQYKAKLAAARLVKSLGNGVLNDQQTEVLIGMLSDRSPRQRAAAAGVLIQHPKKVAGSVIDAFAKPKLRSRLAALDVLSRWTAPIEDLDPWQPETITEEKIAALRKWSESFGEQKELHSQMRESAKEEAELELDRLVRRGEVREGIIDSLGLSGSQLRPSVDQRLETESADTARERLSAVLYRLVAAPTLAIRLPNVADDLASLDADPRRAAAKKLSEAAKQEDFPLLETLFGHSDPLVRELALRGLQNAGGGDTERLTELLDDPDKNVRAAVLKLWLDNPRSSLVKPVSQHAMEETDSGLLVYYVRLLKELKSNSVDSHHALRKLASSRDWQVRAEVAEAISTRVSEAAKNAPTVNGVKNVPFPDPLREAARDLLGDDDSFVLSKIVPAILAADQRASFDKLLEVAWKNESIRGEILPKLTDSVGKKKSVEFLTARFESDVPADRVFALDAMSRFKVDDQPQYIRRGIEDSDPSVQVAAAKSLTQWLDAYHARLDQLPPSPAGQNGVPFGFSGDSSNIVFPPAIAMEDPFSSSDPPALPEPLAEIEASTTPGGLLGTLGSMFGAGSPPRPVPPGPATELQAVPSEPQPLPVDDAIEELLQILDDDEAADSPPTIDDNQAINAGQAGEDLPSGADDQQGLFLDAGDETLAPIAPDPFLPVPSEVNPPGPANLPGLPQRPIPAPGFFPEDKPAEPPPTNNLAPAKDARPITKTPQMLAAEKYDEWLAQWRQSPESTLPWLAGLRERLEKLAEAGEETETHAMMAALRLGATAEAKDILLWASRTTRMNYRLANLYPWLDSDTRRELFKLAGESKEASDILPMLLEKARRFDPQHASQAYWQSLQRVKISALSDTWELRRKLMLVTVGSEYLNISGDEQLEPIATQLASRLQSTDKPAARLIGLSVLGELAPEKVGDLVGDDYRDASIDSNLRRDWARMAIASRGEEDAVTLAFDLMDDEVLLPVALAFLTESYEGISRTEIGPVEVNGVGSDSYSRGRIKVATLSPLIKVEQIQPLLRHADPDVVARATYALVILGENTELEPLIEQARKEGLSGYLEGMTDLLVMAIAYRDLDEEVPILEEIYNLMSTDNEYYIREFYWKIRIMTGPRALALRKRIRDEVGMGNLT